MEKSKIQKSLLKALIYGTLVSFVYAFLAFELDHFSFGIIYIMIILTPILFIGFLTQKSNNQFKVSLKNDPDSLSSEEYTFKMFLSWHYFIAFMLIGYGIWLLSDSISDGIIRSIGLSFFVILLIIRFATTSLVISKDEIEYRTFGNCIHAKWEDLETFKFSMWKYGTQRREYLVFKYTEFTGNDFSKGLNIIFENEHHIPLHIFSENWREEELGDVIHQHVQGLEL